jgi:two-component system sensor histidine kinase CpxA
MRRVQLPLYLKILGWFFLNLALLCGGFALLFQAQFRLNLDWLFTVGARERFEAARDLVISELNTTSPEDWGQVIYRFDAAYQNVRFGLFDEDAKRLVGEIEELPEDVRKRILEGPPELARRLRPSSGDGEVSPLSAQASPEPDLEPGNDAGRRRRRRPPPIRALLRTTDPTQYWLLASGRVENQQLGDPMRVILVANSSSISAGGLIFNLRPWIEVGLGAVVFSLLFWLPLVGGITRSVGQMTQATRQIADGRFDVRVAMRRRDELGSLAESINQMAARLDGFVKGQKRFLGDIAHELCSPLARLQLALGILEERAGEGQIAFVQSAAEKAEQMAALVGELLLFSKAAFGGSAVRLQPVDVRAAAEEAVRREAVEGADVRLGISPNLFAAADPDLLIRALANLIRNAIRYAGKEQPIELRAAREGAEAVIRVIDSGPGVPEEELAKIFEPFYRLDASRTRDTGNVGLGLTIVKACVQSCCGSVTAHNHRQPKGFEVQIRLGAAEKVP